MAARDRLVLRAAAVWFVFVFVVLVRNVLRDHVHAHETAFKVVHIALAVISIAFAVAIWLVASRAGRREVRGGDPARAVES